MMLDGGFSLFNLVVNWNQFSIPIPIQVNVYFDILGKKSAFPSFLSG